MKFGKIPALALTLLLVCVCCVSVVASADYGQNNGGESQSEIDVTDYLNAIPRMKNGDSIGFTMKADNEDAFAFSKLIIQNFDSNELAMGGQLSQGFVGADLISAFNESGSWDEFVSSLTDGGNLELGLDADFTFDGKSVSDSRFEITMLGTADVRFALGFPMSSDYYVWSGFGDDTPYDLYTMDATVNVKSVIAITNGVVTDVVFDAYLDGTLGSERNYLASSSGSLLYPSDDICYEQDISNTVSIRASQQGIGSVTDLNDALNGRGNGMTLAMDVFLAHSYEGLATYWNTGAVMDRWDNIYEMHSSLEDTIPAEAIAAYVAMATEDSSSRDPQLVEQFMMFFMTLDCAKLFVSNPGYTSANEILSGFGYYLSEDTYFRFFDVLNAIKDQAFEFNRSTATSERNAIFEGYAMLGKLKFHEGLKDSIAANVSGVEVALAGKDTPYLEGNYTLSYDKREDCITNLSFYYEAPLSGFTLESKIGGVPITDISYQERIGGSNTDSMNYSEYCLLQDKPEYVNKLIIDHYQYDVVIDSDVGVLTTNMTDYERTNIHSVIVNGDVAVIATGAFRNCTNLEVVRIESVGTIENNAFYGCLALSGFTEDKSPYHIAETIRNGYSGPYGGTFAQSYTDNTVGSTTATLTSMTDMNTNRITVTSYDPTYYGSSASSTYYSKTNGYYGHANYFNGGNFSSSVGYYEVLGEYVHVAYLAYVDNLLIEASVYAPVSSFTDGNYQANAFASSLYTLYSNAVAPVPNPSRVLSLGSIGTIKDGAFNTLEKADRLLLLKTSENVGFNAFTRPLLEDAYNLNNVEFSVGKASGQYVAYVHSFLPGGNHPLTVAVPDELESSQTSMDVTEVDLYSSVYGNVILRAGVIYHFYDPDVYENGPNGCTFTAEESSLYTVAYSDGYSIVIFEGRAVAVADSRPNDYGLPENETERVFVIPEGLTEYHCAVPRTMDRIVTPDSLIRFIPNNYQSTFFHLEIGRNLNEISTSSISSASIRSTNDYFSIIPAGDFSTLVSASRIVAVWGTGTEFTVPAHVGSFDISSLSANDTVQKVVIGNDVVELRGSVGSGSISEIVIGPNVASNSLRLSKAGMTVILSSENRALGNYAKDGMVYLNNRLVYANELPADGIINADSTTTYVGYIPGARVYCLPIGAYPISDNVSGDRVLVGTNMNYMYSGCFVRINCDYIHSDIEGIAKRPDLTYETSYYGYVSKCNSLFEYRVVSYDSDTRELVIEFTGSYPDLFGITCSTFGVEVETISPNSFRATLSVVPNSTQNLQVDLVPCTHKVTFDMGTKTYDVEQFSFLNMEFPENSDNLSIRAGLLFAGWYEDPAYTVPFDGVYNKDVNRYYAKYISYTDFFVIDTDKATSDVGAVNGMTTEFPTVTPLEGYEFLGWSAMGMFISADSTDGMSVPYYDLLQNGQKCTAVFKKTQLPTYEVKYILNGEVYDTKTKTEGDIIYNAPMRDNDAFQYWSINGSPAKMFNIVRGNMTFTAVIETFTVTWTDEDGTVLKTKTVGKGTVPEYDTEVPTKKSTDAFEYEFAGWDPVVTAIDGDTVYKATYNEFPLYTVTWKNYDGTVLYSIKVRKDTVPEYNGELPLKDADVRYTYQFDKWSPAMEAVTSDTVYVATFKVATELDYTITWKNYDGTILQSSKVRYAEMPAYDGPAPVKNSTDRADYEFSSWSPAVAVVTGEAVYTAQFTEYALHYITWKNHDGTVLATSAALRPGVPAEYSGATPEKTAEHYEYVFKDWSKSEAANGDITCTATFTETPKNYPVVFIVDGVREESQAPYGSLIVLPAEPVYNDGRVFVRWAGYQYGITVGEINEFTAEYTQGTIESENGKTTKTYDLDDGSSVTVIADENTGVVSTNTSKTVEDGDKTTVTKEEVVTDLSGKPLGSTETVTETVVDETAGSTLVNNQVTQKDASGNTTQTVTDTTLTRTDSTTVSKEVVDANGNSSVTADSQVKAESVSGTVKVEDSVIDNALNDLATVTENTSANATKDLTVTVKSDDTESSSATTTVSKDALGKVSDAGAKLALEAGVGNVTIDANVAKNLSEKQIDGEVSLNIRMADKATMTSQQRNVVGNATVIELTAKVGNESVHQLGGVATITVPYALKYWENPDNIKVWYITDDGHYYLADSVVYSNLNGGTVTFTTTHFSMYVISTEANLGSAHGDFVETIPLVCVSLIAVACIIAAAFAVASAARKRD